MVRRAVSAYQGGGPSGRLAHPCLRWRRGGACEARRRLVPLPCSRPRVSRLATRLKARLSQLPVLSAGSLSGRVRASTQVSASPNPVATVLGTFVDRCVFSFVVHLWGCYGGWLSLCRTTSPATGNWIFAFLVLGKGTRVARHSNESIFISCC